MSTPPPDLLRLALRRISAALQGLKFDPVAIGALARLAYGSTTPPERIELLVPTGEAQRAQIFGAARGEGLRQVPDNPLRLLLTDEKLGGTATIDLVEATTPFHKDVIARAQERSVLGMPLKLATPEDLILWHAGEHAVAVELLRLCAGRIDAMHLKKAAEAAGSFDRVKAAWAEAKQLA